MKNAITAAAALSLLAFVLPGCKGKIDPTKVEALCKSALKDGDIEIKSVSCPKDVEMKKGNDFECTVTTTDGDDLTMSVTQEDDRGTVYAKVKSGTMDLEKVGDSIEKKVGEKVDIKCKSRFIVAKVDKKYTCDADVDGKPKKVEIVFTDKKGNLKWKLLDE